MAFNFISIVRTTGLKQRGVFFRGQSGGCAELIHFHINAIFAAADALFNRVGHIRHRGRKNPALTLVVVKVVAIVGVGRGARDRFGLKNRLTLGGGCSTRRGFHHLLAAVLKWNEREKHDQGPGYGTTARHHKIGSAVSSPDLNRVVMILRIVHQYKQNLIIGRCGPLLSVAESASKYIGL